MATATAQRKGRGHGIKEVNDAAEDNGETTGQADPGEQLDLIEVEPENAKEIARIARRYKAAQRARMDALEEEIDCKKKLLDAVHEAHIATEAGKDYRFKCGEVTIIVKPRDELVRVKLAEDEDDDSAE